MEPTPRTEHELNMPTCAGEGRASSPQNVEARRPLQGLYRRGIESIWRCHPEQRATGSRARRLSALISTMRVLSSLRTVASAEKTLEATISAYFAPNKTIRELHDLMKSGAGIDPLKDFSEAAREELREFSPL